MNRRYLCYVLYFGGTALVFLQWIHVVSTGVGWTGWVIGMLGWVLWPREKMFQAASPKSNDQPPTSVEQANDQRPQSLS